MKPYRLTPAAQRDLSQIWDDTEEQWDLRQAETYIGDLWSAVERIAADPSLWRQCDDVRTGYRRYAIGSHLVFYVETEATVDVIRILHQRIDPGRHL